jgi:hypothetical protein
VDARGDGFVSAGVRRARMERRKKGMAIGHCIGVLGMEAISMISVDMYRLLLTWCRTG